MFCRNCGKPVEDEAKYCQSCGMEIISPGVENPINNMGARKPDDGIVENFFKLHGRLNRKRYIKRNFALAGLAILCFIPFVAVFDQVGQFEGVGMAIGAFFLIPSYCIDVRRLEDMGYGPGAAILVVITNILCQVLDEERYPHIVGGMACGQFVFFLYCAIKKGTTGQNQYGEDPLQ